MRPVVVHLTSYRFGPASHPAIYRAILGMEGHGTQVVLDSRTPGYLETGVDDEGHAALAERGIHLFPDALRGVKKPWRARHLAIGLRRRFGRVAAVVGHLGNNGWRALPLGRSLDSPVVTIFHGSDVAVDLPGPRYGWRYGHLFEAPAAHFLAVADHLRDGLVAAGAPPSRTATHHLGVDPTLFAPDPRARAEGPFRMVLIGRFIEVKGHAGALDAFARLAAKRPEAELHFFGEGPLEKELRARTTRLGIEAQVHFRGVLPEEALRHEFARAHVAVQPSVAEAHGSVEGVPNGVLEAMASALPVVATRHGGIPEAVVDGETGLLPPEGDVDALAEALLALAEDPARREALGRAGRRRIETHFDLRHQGSRLAAVCARANADYQALGLVARRRAWARACDGLVDTTGRRQQASYQLRNLANYVRGQIP